jgi:hypothetical protein
MEAKEFMADGKTDMKKHDMEGRRRLCWSIWSV